MSVALGLSTTNISDESKTDSRAGTIGDLSSNNKLTAGDYYEQGLTGENLYNVIDAVRDSATANFAQSISAVQNSARQAIEATGQAYNYANSESRNLIDGFKPIALFGFLGMALYYVLKR